MKRIACCAFVLLVVASAEPGRAAEDGDRAAAGEHYTRGIDLATQGLYEAALEQFNQAYAKSPHFAVLYNIGQAQIALGRPLEALEALSSYLRDGADKVPLSRREQVQAQIALLETKLAELTIASDTPGVAIRVDDRDVGRTPLFQPIRLAAGTHKITASLLDGPRIMRVVTLGEAERQRLELAFAPMPPAAAGPPASSGIAVPAAEPPSTASQAPVLASPPSAPAPAGDNQGFFTMRRTAYLSAAVGAVAAGAALGVYLWNRGRYEDWRAENAALAEETIGSIAYRMRALKNNELAASLTTANDAIVGLSIAGGVLLATGATLYLVDREFRRRAGELTFMWNGGSIAVVGWSQPW